MGHPTANRSGLRSLKSDLMLSFFFSLSEEQYSEEFLKGGPLCGRKIHQVTKEIINLFLLSFLSIHSLAQSREPCRPSRIVLCAAKTLL